jgi:hypothetical protein
MDDVKEEEGMNLTAWEVHQAGKLSLPPGYHIELDADLVELHRPDSSVVAVFSARGVAPSVVARTAEEDYRTQARRSSA